MVGSKKNLWRRRIVVAVLEVQGKDGMVLEITTSVLPTTIGTMNIVRRVRQRTTCRSVRILFLSRRLGPEERMVVGSGIPGSFLFSVVRWRLDDLSGRASAFLFRFADGDELRLDTGLFSLDHRSRQSWTMHRCNPVMNLPQDGLQ